LRTKILGAIFFIIFCLTIPATFIAPAASAASITVVGKFNVPLNCCISFVYANNNIFGMGKLGAAGLESDVYVFSASNNAILATIPMSDPYYILYDSVDKTVVVFGTYSCTPSTTCNDIVSISATTYKTIANTTVPFFNYPYGYPPNSVPITYDSHNDEIYAGSTVCGAGSSYGLCQVFVVNAKTLSTIKTLSFASGVGGGAQIWSVVYDSKNNEIFVTASDGPLDVCACYGSFVTISASTNKIVSIQGTAGSPFLYIMPYYLQLDTSNNLLYAFDFVSNGIDVFNAANGGAYVTTIDPNYGFVSGLMPGNFALDGNLISGMFYGAGCYTNGGVVNGGGCVPPQYYLNGTYYKISGTTIGAGIPSFSTSTNANCLSPFWSGVSKLTYVDCGSKLFVFNTSTGKLTTSINVQGSIMVFNRLTDLLYVESGNTIYEVGT